MQLLSRDLRKIYYALFEGMKPVVIEDEYGNKLETGEQQIAYSDPIPLRASVSPARGEASTRQFGEQLLYDKTVAFVGKPLMSEQAVLWIDCLRNGNIPEENGKRVPFDYTISKIADDEKGNNTVLAVQKVDVS